MMNTSPTSRLAAALIVQVLLSGIPLAPAQEQEFVAAAGGWQYRLARPQPQAEVFRAIEFRKPGVPTLRFKCELSMTRPILRVNPNKSRMAFYDGATKRIVIFDLDDHLPLILSRNEPSDFLQEIWWDKGKRKEVLYPWRLAWMDKDRLIVEALGKPGEKDNDRFIYDVVASQLIVSREYQQKDLFENDSGLIRQITLDAAKVDSAFQDNEKAQKNVRK